MAEPSTETKIQPQQPEPMKLSSTERAVLHEHAVIAARSCGWIPGKHHSSRPRELFRENARLLGGLQAAIRKLKSKKLSEDLQWLSDNLRLVRTDIEDLHDATRILARLPLVRTSTEESIPRCIVLARALLVAADYRLTEAAFSYFLDSVQEVEPLRFSELAGLLPALKLALLELIADRGHKALEAFHAEGVNAPSLDIARLLRSLRLIGEMDWKETLEQLSFIHRVLLLDPADVYPRMDFVSREFYRKAAAQVAAHSDFSEVEVARLAVTMAEEARIDRSAPEALRERLRHVGYYLVDDVGSQELLDRVVYRLSFSASVQRLFRKYPDEVYVIGIEFVTLITVVALIMSIVRTHTGIGVLAGALLLILPATQAAVELMNYFVTTVLSPRILPKLDFSKGIDAVAATMVGIPTLLLKEKQIRELVDDLEVRYLVNRDPNIFYALLTDLPDTAEPVGERDSRIDLAVRLIDDLNRKYADEPYGGFYLFHRHRVYNPREGAWMGWERKRGKLLDLNQFLRKGFDPFPVKTGDLSRLPKIRYVITLDSDTQLPRGSAQRLIGTMAHPLNRPLIDPELNIVTQGYGILQPRVGISVHSATRSHLASIYSGQTGFDIYSRAVSDVYQDLYGEGIFTGKGIYDVDALRQVLEHRFPRNALLSHDLIEGAYARAGLVSDIEVIDDYPSHYSAYNRRKHRWLRGDWQIVRWIFNQVPNESRQLVHNPISLVSRWKIVDNLRRSLIEPATFFLLVAGWFFLPGTPRFWTIVTVALLFLPIYFRLIFSLIRTISDRNWSSAREAFSDFGTEHLSILLNIAFLAHQTLVALDAVIRTIVRSYITHSRLLEWETATEAELDMKKRTPVDVYLQWVPALAVGLVFALFFKPSAAPYALPFIAAWCCSTLISNWINRSPHPQVQELTKAEQRFLREVALRTWRYFSDFSTEKNNWLIPDNVQEQPYQVAERLSTTNLGLLFNSRQAALEFGYLTLPEFVTQTELTLRSVLKLPRYFGHFVNWYETVTLKPIKPLFISSVDNGNLLASLWSLKQGCLELLHQPLIRQNTLNGLCDHHCMLGSARSGGDSFRKLFTLKDPTEWLPKVIASDLSSAAKQPGSEEHDVWAAKFRARVEALREAVRNFTPWYLPEFTPLRNLSPLELEFPPAVLIPENAAGYYGELDRRLKGLTSKTGVSQEIISLASRLREELPACQSRLSALASRLQSLAADCDRLAAEMDFTMLVDKRRDLLATGYHVDKQELTTSCYDLLASEARAAAFIAVARGQISEQCWFRLSRQHTVCEGE
jgi:cyclic beta-1,2-glucan synthetase